ncbi:hypothetical protein L1987_47931 [Smallanthus sonchifolius]|uniref:Uncharacterized protein n=1 Tax=Smallanthus sonchifolius TaxID=185202 RepID=A0ACB9FQJ3_9ASTR|nr:hypothetical protein L1987_47931 [Smallanthus sonchifolius]
MASQESQFRAGEAKGQAEEKTGQVMGNIRDKAQQGKDKTSETAGSAWNKTKESTDQTGSYVSEKASQMSKATKDKASDMAQSTKETAQAGKEKTGGMMQRTGEKVKGMAQGAADAVKSTFGMGGDEDSDAIVCLAIFVFIANNEVLFQMCFVYIAIKAPHHPVKPSSKLRSKTLPTSDVLGESKQKSTKESQHNQKSAENSRTVFGQLSKFRGLIEICLLTNGLGYFELLLTLRLYQIFQRAFSSIGDQDGIDEV